ncbi:MAG: ribonuclease [Actinomycetota bacterium]|nr:ribonuclease [Actinomycetota bacterium]
MSTVVYTDGACSPNPGPGGWAWAVPDGPYATGVEAQSTNQRMEVTAALEAVRALPGALVVVSDSQYVVKCHTDRWYEKWEKSGWNNSNRKPVANADLWKPLVALFHARGDELRFQWVRGHSDDPMNDVVDRLAVEAARTQTARSGDEPPTELGPADEPHVDRVAPRSASSLAAPDGHAVVVLGHRPPELGGYGDNAIAAGVRRKLAEILTGLQAVHPDLVVLTGLGLGAEQLGADAAADANVPYVAVLPFPDPDAVWPAASRAAYQRLVAGAASTLVISNARPSSKQAAGMALGRRDDWLRTHANGALVVWDGKDRTIATTVKALERRIPDDVWIVPPAP